MLRCDQVTFSLHNTTIYLYYLSRLELNIWEFEWKRLEKHSRKAVAPMIVFGYFR